MSPLFVEGSRLRCLRTCILPAHRHTVLILIYVFAMLKGSKESNDRRLLFGSMTVFTILLLFQSITHAHYILWALLFVPCSRFTRAVRA